MIEKTEGTLKMDNPDTGNFGHKRHRMKTNKHKTQYRKLKRWATRTPQKKTRCSRWV